MEHHPNLPKEIHDIYNEIKDTNKFTHTKISALKERIYKLKMKYLEETKVYNVLEHMLDVLSHEDKKLSTLKMTIISAIGTIFLPLGFITGYFGMNFRSMGNPSLREGVLATKHVERFIFGLSIFCMVVIGSLYYINY